MKKRYKLISEDLMKNIIEFLDEIQFDEFLKKLKKVLTGLKRSSIVLRMLTS